jgi:hypothetical protein
VNRAAFAIPAIVLFVSLVVWGAVTPPREEERIQGTVVDATASYCEPKKVQGCTGTLTLAARDKTLTIKVPLGTPISAGCDALPFGALPGRQVTVTEVSGLRGPVATAISAADMPEPRAC